MTDFKTLKRKAKEFAEGDLKIAVAGDCATQFLTTAIKGALSLRGIGGQVFEAEYDQVARQLLVADSDLHQFAPSIVVVWETVERWWASGISAQDRLAAVERYAAAFPGKILYLNAAPFRDGVFGNYVANGNSFAAQIRAFNAGLDALATRHPNLYVIDLHALVASVGRAQAYDAPTYALADMPLVPDIQARLATSVADVIAALQGKVRKCIVLDLDNTLWGGVIGEDGLGGIRLGGHGDGKSFVAFQRYLRRLKERGILLAVCSKNDEAMAREPFEQHPDMVLHLDDIACFVANWETKADNIAHIQKVLNIGMDSFVFIDDNPVEREIVRTAHPQVAVPEMPSDVATWIDFLADENFFETVSYSATDADRTKQYQIQAQRVAFEATFTDEKSFLRGLDMHATVAPLDAFTIPRAAQLTQRSNQFNLRTVRYTESDLTAYANDPSVVQLGFTLSDRFGSHGLVSVVIGKVGGLDVWKVGGLEGWKVGGLDDWKVGGLEGWKVGGLEEPLNLQTSKPLNLQNLQTSKPPKPPTILFLDTWLMSCRVLKRGLENYALNRLVEIARARGVTHLVGEYLPTKKNGMVANFYKEMGFTKLSDTQYLLDLATFNPRETEIHDENE